MVLDPSPPPLVPILVMDMYIQAYMVEINIRESGCGMSPPMCVNVCYEYVYKCTHGWNKSLPEWLCGAAIHVCIFVMNMYIHVYMVEMRICESGCGLSPLMCQYLLWICIYMYTWLK